MIGRPSAAVTIRAAAEATAEDVRRAVDAAHQAFSDWSSRTAKERAAVLADCLGRLGDERALPLLKKRAASEETPYLDYIELRSAIEALGGEAPEREFDAEDPAYDALRSMQ